MTPPSTFDIQASLTYDFADPCEVLLLVEAARGPDQSVRSEALTFSPSVDAVSVDDPVTQERRTVFTAAGRVSVTYRAQVEIASRDHALEDAPAIAIRDLPGQVLPFLRASRYSPSDRLERFADRQFGAMAGGRRVMAILDWIAANIDYQAGVSHSATTAVETFIDRAGVCRDFSHLLIALCRAADIPARAVSAYAWSLEPRAAGPACDRGSLSGRAMAPGRRYRQGADQRARSRGDRPRRRRHRLHDDLRRGATGRAELQDRQGCLIAAGRNCSADSSA